MYTFQLPGEKRYWNKESWAGQECLTERVENPGGRKWKIKRNSKKDGCKVQENPGVFNLE